MMATICVLAFVLCVLASGFFSGSETGLYCVNRLRLRLRADRGEAAAVRLQRLLDDEPSALGVILVGTNVANYLTTVCMALLLSARPGLSDREVEIYTTLLVTPVVFVWGEVVPKNLFQRAADRLLYTSGLGLSLAGKLFAPLVWGIRILADRMVTALGSAEAEQGARDHRWRMAGLLRDALADRDRAGRHGEFVDRALLLSETAVTAAMVPMSEVVTISARADRAAFLEVARSTTHSRLVVVRGDRPRVQGVVDVQTLLADDTWQRIEDRTEDVVHLRPRESIASAIVRVHRSARAMALVSSPGGAVLGVVTLKDLLEEVVGELEDA